jgi:CheY-like chemotaxis protein
MSAEGHDILVVDDDAAVRETLKEVFEARGDRVRFSATVEEALRAIEERLPCCLVADQEVPLRTGGKALTIGGARIMTALRQKDARRNEDGWHILPILVLSGQPSTPDFVDEMHDLGADGFVEKPLGKTLGRFLEKVTLLLGRAGRGDHAGCAGLEVGAVTTAETDVVRLVLDGTAGKGRTRVFVNASTCDLQDALFTYLLRLTLGAQKSRESWWEGAQVGIDRSPKVVSRTRLALNALAPKGFDFIQADRRGGTRLNPAVEIGTVAWERLAVHPSAAIRKIAAGRAKVE